jgi:hypothetical protein
MRTRLKVVALAVLADSSATKQGRLEALKELDRSAIGFLRDFVDADGLDNELRFVALRLLERFETEQAQIDAEQEREAEIVRQRVAAEKAAAERKARIERLTPEVEALMKQFPSLELLQAQLARKETPTEAERILLAGYEQRRRKEETDAETERLLAERLPQPPRQLSPGELRAKQIAEEQAEEARKRLRDGLLDASRREGANPYNYVGSQPVRDGRPRFDAWGNRYRGDAVLEEW